MQLLNIPAAILLLTSVLSVNAEPEGLQLRSPNPDVAEGPGNLGYEESWLAKRAVVNKRAEGPFPPGEGHPIPKARRAGATKVKRAAADKRASGPSNGATGHAVVN
ncbi:hypothetical protein HYALB_00009072 [Hymenoscyphus albidus]|uniref:Uncharacterized protein n=1 Tax=Hymenoscyphus albidus TaxID=595503 RepID=A0A9N9Q818_9HELO|nr:hypothetical protein HYALB_00009072 [Hymenoscyphus albidus]